MERLLQLFAEHFGAPADTVAPLKDALGASGRKLFRLRNTQASAIGVVYTGREENVAFLTFSRHFRACGLAVPEIYAEDLARDCYLEQDLGDTTLFAFLAANRQGPRIAPPALEIYRRVLAQLPRFQVEAGRTLDYSVCTPRAAFDRQSIAWDLAYFKHYFLRLAGVEFNEQALEDDFDALTALLLSEPADFFMYRDFQSRNVMLVDGRPHFIDYQGGRRGALQYDVASLLYDAKADLPQAARAELLEHYLGALENYLPVDHDRFLRAYPAFALIRILQALGAYGYRGYFERKPLFLRSIPYALANLNHLLDAGGLPLRIPELRRAARAMAESETLRRLATAAAENTAEGAGAGIPLAVRILSFSFHRGLPRDAGGHGGGHIFDARCLPNPGRERGFMQLCGQDDEVCGFLDLQPETHTFFQHALALVEMSIASYKSRGFDSLQVAFGCTGGQHRSVYLAEKLAAALEGRAGVRVALEHRELERMGWRREAR